MIVNGGAFMLYPQMNTHRELVSLDGFWKFASDPNNNGQELGWPNGIPNEREMAVPASWNEQHQDLMYFFHTGWYEKTINIPTSFQSKLVWLRVGAANYLSKVWVNGEFVGEHEGAHLPFEFEISEYLKFGKGNKIVIAVDAQIKKDRLPPGNVEDEQVIGFKGQYPNNYYDFFPYGGINRPIQLYTTFSVHIKSVEVDTDLVDHQGIVHYRICLNKKFTGTVEIRLDNDTKETLSLHEQHAVRGELVVSSPRLWSMDDPFMYPFQIQLFDQKNERDRYCLLMGLRKIELKDKQLLLNGEKVFLKGFGMHEDFAVLGKGMNHAVIAKDVNLLKWMGANSLRTSHYPYSEEFLQYADRNGLLVIGETPFVGFVRSHYKDAAILGKAKKVITEMITRDRNHPSIIAWSLANEGDTFVSEADEFYKSLYDHAKSIDHTRPITIVNCVDVEEDVALKHFDFISLNRYYGWYEQAGRLDEGCSMLEQKLDRCYEVFGKPIIVTEFGADAVAGMHIDPPEQFSEEYQAEMVTRQYEIIENKPYTIGAHVWSFADFKTSQTPSRVIVNRKGLFTRDRQPKLAAHKMRQMWSE